MSATLWLVALACLAATVAWLVLHAQPRAAAIPLPRRERLAASLRRSRLVAVAAACVLAAATIGLSFATRTSTPGRQVLPTGSTAMIVLDLSDSTTRYFTQIAGTLDSLTRESNRHLGLVVDSNTAYVALPPTTPVEGLRGWLHAFVRSPFLDYPWKGTFSQGTELSKGLVVARSALLEAHVRNPHVVLVTDLSDDTFDLQRLSAVVTQYQREHIDLRIVSLGENQSASAKLNTPNWHNAAYIARAASTVASPLGADGVATHKPSLVPIALLLIVVALAATLLAARFHPLRWRTA
jgi:hypothetical protein